MLCFATAHNWDKLQKTRQKLDSKIREIDWSYLCLQQFDEFWIQSEYIQRKSNWHERTRKIIRSGLIFGGFLPFGATVRLLLWNYSNVLLFFSFPPTLTILHHHTKQIIAWFAPMLFIHQHNCIKKLLHLVHHHCRRKDQTL